MLWPKTRAPPTHGVVAIGGSAGGVEALCRVAASLPDDVPYAVLKARLVPHGPSVLAEIVNRSDRLPADTAEQDTILGPGQIYAAVPGGTC